jgi:hypothetical protein
MQQICHTQTPQQIIQSWHPVHKRRPSVALHNACWNISTGSSSLPVLLHAQH